MQRCHDINAKYKRNQEKPDSNRTIGKLFQNAFLWYKLYTYDVMGHFLGLSMTQIISSWHKLDRLLLFFYKTIFLVNGISGGIKKQ